MKKAARTIFNKPWKHLLAALVGFVLAYVLASWGIDSGRLTAYFGAIVFGILAIQHTAKAIRGYARQS